MNWNRILLGFILCCLGTLTPTRAATITGQLLNITGANHPDKRVVFTPVDTPRHLPNGSVLWTPTQVTSVNGAFTVVLGAGHYRVSIDGIVWAYRCIPDSDATFTFNSADIFCGTGTGIFLRTNDLYKVLTSTSDGFPSYLYSSLLAGTNIVLEDIDDGSGTNRVVKINASASGRTGNNTQFDDDGTTLTITNVHGVAGSTLWTNSAGTLQPIDLTAQPYVQKGWLIGQDAADWWGDTSNGETLIGVQNVGEGDPNNNEIFIATVHDGTNFAEYHVTTTTNSVTQTLTQEVAGVDSAVNFIVDGSGPRITLSTDGGGVTPTKLFPGEADGSIPYIFDTSISQTLGPVLALRNNTVDSLKFGPGAQIGFGVGSTNTLARYGQKLLYENIRPYLGVTNSGAWLELSLSGGTTPTIDGSGPIFVTDTLVTQSLQPDSGNLRTIGALQNSAGAYLYTYAKTNVIKGFDDGSGDYSWLSIAHTGTNGNVLFDSQSKGVAGIPRDFLWQSNGVTVAKVALNSGYAGGGTLFLSDDGTYKSAGGGGGGSDNWVASGTTNSTLPGIGSANALIGTNGVYAGKGFYAPWWTPSIDDTFIGIHDVSLGDSDYSFLYVGNVDNGMAETNYADFTITTKTSSLSPGAILNLAAVATNMASTFVVNLQPDQGVARIELFNDNTNTFAVLDNSGYTGTGTLFLSDDGTYKTAGAGGTVGTVINTGAPGAVGDLFQAIDATGTNGIWSPRIWTNDTYYASNDSITPVSLGVNSFSILTNSTLFRAAANLYYFGLGDIFNVTADTTFPEAVASTINLYLSAQTNTYDLAAVVKLASSAHSHASNTVYGAPSQGNYGLLSYMSGIGGSRINGDSAALVGHANNSASLSIGVLGIGRAGTDVTNTLVGVMGTGDFSGNSSVGMMSLGGYFQSGEADNFYPNLEPAVVLIDNLDSGYPLIVGRTNNGTTVFKVDGVGAVTSSSSIKSASGAFTNGLTAGASTFTKSVAYTPVTLTDAATISTDASQGVHFRVTLGGNRTLGNPTNPSDGQRMVWEVIQDATGVRTLAMDTKFAFGTDITGITLTTNATKRDFITAVYNSTADKFFVTGFVRGY